METIVKYIFRCGFDEIEKGENTFRYLRIRGRELAQQMGKPVQLSAYNELVPRWEHLGTDYPDGTCINSFGDIMVLDDDGRNYRIIGKDGKQTSQAERRL